MTNRQIPKAPRDYLIPAVIVTFLCFFPTGIAAIVYAYQARSKKKAGNYRSAAKDAKLARLYTITSLVIAIILYGATGIAWLAGFRGSG